MNSKLHLRVSGFLAALLISTASMASGLSTYNQDFENLDIAGAEIGGGWLFFNNVFAGDTFLFGYNGAAPNGPQISALVDDQRDPPGSQQLSVYSDYECCQPDTGHNGVDGIVQTNVFQEQVISECNVGETWTFNFDAKLGNIGGSSTATAFVKVLDPNSGFSTTTELTVDTTATPADWTNYQIQVDVGDWAGQILQFGFQTVAGSFEPSGVFYDDVSFSGSGAAGICPFSDDFESYIDTAPDELGNAGYLIFANVFAPDNSFLFGYGPFPAPNGSGAFSGISVGEGGTDQGSQQLNVFSDYNNVDAHSAGNLIESVVYREQTIGAANVGQTWRFTFDAKLGNLLPPSTAKAFIKTLDPANGFATTNEVAQDTTNTPVTWQGYELTLNIDASLVGQLIQIGFSNVATNFDSSAVFYDNINFDIAPTTDFDGDSIDDSVDNCTLVPNTSQLDTNGDGFGNACDPDINNDGIVNFVDVSLWVPFFNTPVVGDEDFNGDGVANFVDFVLFSQYFLQPPGPAAD